MKYYLRPLALAAAVLSLSTPANAQMNYQGRLTGPTGAARAPGPTKLTFSIYDAAGTKIWGDYIMDGVAGNGHGPKADLIADGRFNVIIGATDTSSDTMTSAIAAAGTGAIFLEIKVENEAAISPRQQILATPRALFADTIPNVTPTANGNIGIGVFPSARLQVNGAPDERALRVQVNGQTKLIVDGNGGVSVGSGIDTPPANGLRVKGDILENGQEVTSGAEDLRLIRGIVNLNGSRRSGAGFSSNVSASIYTVTYDTAFASGDIPVVTANVLSTDGADLPGIIDSSTNTGFVIRFGAQNITRTRSVPFNFIVVGRP